MIKYGVTSYSFDQYLATGAMDLYGAIRKAAEMGFDGIELANITENYPYELEKLKQTAQEAGIEICAWATSADFLKDIPEQVRYLKEEIDRAAYLGCKVLRTDVFHDEYVPDPYAENIVKALRELASYAQEKGMVLTTEITAATPVCPTVWKSWCRRCTMKTSACCAISAIFWGKTWIRRRRWDSCAAISAMCM